MFPAQALAEILNAKGWDVAMMTDSRGRRHAGKIPADPIIEVEAASITPRRPLQAVIGVMKLAKGVRQAKTFMRRWKPDVVVGFGGYPAFPAMRAAHALKLPAIIHEQNAVLGRVNRAFAAEVRYVASGFDSLMKLPDAAEHRSLGNPLREQIIQAIPKAYHAPKGDIHILIVGGSLGARLISETVPTAIAMLPENLRSRLQVTQQTREESLDAAIKTYQDAGVRAQCDTFFGDIETHLAKAHYVIGRAGASTVSEVAAMGKPALFVPLAIAMDDHQTENAKALKSLGAADILPESEFTPETVKSTLEKRLNDSNWLKRAAKAAKSAARPGAAADLAKLVDSVLEDA
jgi:UDP-N-acetylglucosamine--N-acetylmuramyl-(pentapeptide) pyrophosphoryl-undecaprenol N-acetylglucosamine transferase